MVHQIFGHPTVLMPTSYHLKFGFHAHALPMFTVYVAFVTTFWLLLRFTICH